MLRSRTSTSRTELHLADPPVEAQNPAKDFSLAIAGPVYRLLERLDIGLDPLPNVARRIAVLLLLTWVPLLLLTASQGTADGNLVGLPLLRDFSIYGRFLLGIPLLVVAETFVDPALRKALHEFSEGKLLTDKDRPAFEAIVVDATRLSNSATIELCILALACFPVFLFASHEWSRISSWYEVIPGAGWNRATWWFATVSTPIFRFLVLRWIWRLTLWGVLLWRISRLDLNLTAIHPDRVGGLSFIGRAQNSLAFVFAALGCVVSGHLANRIAFEGGSLAGVSTPAIGFIVLAVIGTIGPLLVFTPKLVRTRLEGLSQFELFAEDYVEAFDRKWLHRDRPPPAEEELLGTPDIQSLADLGNSFNFVSEMRFLPADFRAVLQIIVLTAIPFVPLVFIALPIDEILRNLVSIFLH